jgi:hypothetical protein
MHERISELTAAFYSAFTNGASPAPVDKIYAVCLPEAVIVNASSEAPAIYNLREFVEPRRALLASGALIDFREYEIAEETTVHGRIAYRFSRYEKTWMHGAEPMRGAGTKIFSFVLTPQGWKIASVLWHDQPGQ